MARLSRAEREAFWRNLIAQRQTSQRTVAAVCRQANVSVASYYHWQKKLLAEGRHPVPDSRQVSPLVPVRIVDDRAAELIVELPNDIRLRLPQSCDEALLRRILRTALTVCREVEAC